MRDFLPENRPLLLLAPMQDITDLAFMGVMERFGGGPDAYVTEYFRVHEDSTLEKHILASVDENHTGKPVLAQMIGQSIPDLVRTAKLLEEHAVAGIDLNLGCPAPVVCNKSAGGGLLRKLPRALRRGTQRKHEFLGGAGGWGGEVAQGPDGRCAWCPPQAGGAV